MLLAPLKALFSKSFYQNALRAWGFGRGFVFVLYLSVLYSIGIWGALVSLERQNPEYLGRLSETHVAMRFLAMAPAEWKITADGLSLYDEAGQEIKQWSFENFMNVDTAQAGLYTTPESFFLVVSKTMGWFPERQGRTFLFEQLHKQSGGDVSAKILRTVGGSLEAIQLAGPQAAAQTITPEDLERAYATLKGWMFVIFILLGFLIVLTWKTLAALTLSLVGLALNAAFKRRLEYGHVFLLALLAQAWVAVLNLIGLLMPVPVPPFLDWLVAIGFLIFVFYKFVPPPESVPVP